MPLLSIVASVLVFALSHWPATPIVPQAGVATASPVPRGDTRFGIHANPDAPDSPPAGVFGVERIWDTGATWCRLNPAPGVWDFTPMLAQLEAAARRGARSAIVVLGFPPPHAVAGPGNPAEAGWLCPQPGFASILPSDPAWDEYVQLTVAQVSAWRVAHPDLAVHFQVWNEPAVPWFLAPGQPPQRLVDLAARARSIVQAALPDALLISPSVVRGRTPQKVQWQAQFVEAARVWSTANGQRLFDVWAVHAYPVGATFDEVFSGTEGYLAEMDDVLRTVTTGRVAGDQVWVTEINANIAFTGAPASVLAEIDQARFVQAVAADTAARGIPVVVWYRWHYDPWQAGSGQIVFSGQSAAMSAWTG